MLGFLQDTLFEEHDTGAHPERPERLQAIRHGIRDLKGEIALEPLIPFQAERSALELVHDPGYVDWVQQQVEGGAPRLDPDTSVCRRSYAVALQAVGGALRGIDAIMAGELKRAFFAIRPPGHHAESNASMGFCLFNNVAIAARHLVVNHRLSRVAIYDFDVHHGNGTMHSFYEDPTIFYSSVHQWPFYPGTGRTEETGSGRGLGTTLNFPLPAGAGDDDYVDATRRFADAMARFKPEFLLLSAGYDAHWADPLAGHQVTEKGYTAMVALLRQVAESHCEGRVAAFLEGGYNLAILRNCVPATLRELAIGL